MAGIDKRYNEWISVEDELPEYDESVLVCNENEADDMWFSHRANPKYVECDEKDFSSPHEAFPVVTHWMRIKPISNEGKATTP